MSAFPFGLRVAWTARVLVVLLLCEPPVLLAGPPARASGRSTAPAAGAAAAQDYERMSLEELRAEAERIRLEIRGEGYRLWEQRQTIYSDQNKAYLRARFDLLAQIQEMESQIERKQLTINKYEANAEIQGRELYPEASARIAELRSEIAGLAPEADRLRERERRVEAERREFERRAWPEVQRAERAHAERIRPLRDAEAAIEEVGRRRFPDEWAAPRTGPARPPTDPGPTRDIRTTIDSPRPATTIEAVNPEVFLEQLLGTMREDARRFPRTFFRAGMPEFAQLTTNASGGRFLNLFSEFDAAREFLENRYRGVDRQIYQLDASDLARTEAGRSFLTHVRDELLRILALPYEEQARLLERPEFALDVPHAESYLETVYENVKPRPQRPMPAAGRMPSRPPAAPPVPQPPALPPESKLGIPEPDLSTPEGVRQETLDRARLLEVLEIFPELEALDNREWLLTPEEGQERLERQLRDQAGESLREVLREDVDPAKRQRVLKAAMEDLDTKVREAAERVVDEGRRTLSRQPPEIATRIARGRAFAELLRGGLKTVAEGRAPWQARGLTWLMGTVAFWDIAWIFAEEGLVAGLKASTEFVIVVAVLNWVRNRGVAGLVLASGAEVVLTAFFIWDLYRRAYRTAVTNRYRGWIIGDVPFTVAVGSDGRYRHPSVLVAGPVTRVERRQIGFLTLRETTRWGVIKSPAYGLSGDAWFQDFPTEIELLNAIVQYEDALALVYGGLGNAPPEFDEARNHAVITETIVTEWRNQWAEQFRLLEEEAAKIRAAQPAAAPPAPPPPDGPEPRPAGTILDMSIEPELPERGDRIEVEIYYRIAGAPGDELDAEARARLVGSGKDQDPSRLTSIRRGPALVDETETVPVRLGVTEAFHTGVLRRAFTIDTPGIYELSAELDLGPAGRSPEPERLRFWIPEYGPARPIETSETTRFEIVRIETADEHELVCRPGRGGVEAAPWVEVHYQVRTTEPMVTWTDEATIRGPDGQLVIGPTAGSPELVFEQGRTDPDRTYWLRAERTTCDPGTYTFAFRLAGDGFQETVTRQLNVAREE